MNYKGIFSIEMDTNKHNGMYKNGQKIFSALWPHN